MTVALMQPGDDIKAFLTNTIVRVNGIDRSVDVDVEGRLTLPPGVHDIELRRPDGYAAAVRIHSVLPTGDELFTLDELTDRVRAPLKEQLATDPDFCTPEVETEVLASLATY